MVVDGLGCLTQSNHRRAIFDQEHRNSSIDDLKKELVGQKTEWAVH